MNDVISKNFTAETNNYGNKEKKIWVSMTWYAKNNPQRKNFETF